MPINYWGRYPCCESDNIHPDDFLKFRENYCNYRVFLNFDEDGSFIFIRDGNNYYRVKKESFKILPSPRFEWGDSVIIKEKHCIAIIKEIMWHADKKEFYYLVAVNGKRKSKRYFENELGTIDEAVES